MSDKTKRGGKSGNYGTSVIRLVRTAAVRGSLKTRIPGAIYLLDGRPRGAAKKPRILTKAEVMTALAAAIDAIRIGVTPRMKRAIENHRRMISETVED